MEILLTPDQIYDTVNPNVLPHYRKGWERRCKPLPPEYEAICRAQVKRVVEWMENNPETEVDEGTLIALRKAAGGGA